MNVKHKKEQNTHKETKSERMRKKESPEEEKSWKNWQKMWREEE